MNPLKTCALITLLCYATPSFAQIKFEGLDLADEKKKSQHE